MMYYKLIIPRPKATEIKTTAHVVSMLKLWKLWSSDLRIKPFVIFLVHN